MEGEGGGEGGVGGRVRGSLVSLKKGCSEADAQIAGPEALTRKSLRRWVS